MLVLTFDFCSRVLDGHYAPILVAVCEKFRYDYIHGLQGEWAQLFRLQWRNCWVEGALDEIMAKYVNYSLCHYPFDLFVLSFFQRPRVDHLQGGRRSCQ